MSGFHVWLRTDDPARILARCRLFIEEPRDGHGGWVPGVPVALWYPISISVLAPLVQDGSGSDGGLPPPLRRHHRRRMRTRVPPGKVAPVDRGVMATIAGLIARRGIATVVNLLLPP